MQGRRRGVVADIGGHHPGGQLLVQGLQVGAVRQEAAFHDDGQEVGFRVVGHRSLVHSRVAEG